MDNQDYRLGKKLTNEDAFKTYIMKVQQGSAVFYEHVQLALVEEYYVDPPSYEELKKISVSSSQLRKIIKKNHILQNQIGKHLNKSNKFTGYFDYILSKYIKKPYFMWKAKRSVKNETR